MTTRISCHPVQRELLQSDLGGSNRLSEWPTGSFDSGSVPTCIINRLHVPHPASASHVPCPSALSLRPRVKRFRFSMDLQHAPTFGDPGSSSSTIKQSVYIYIYIYVTRHPTEALISRKDSLVPFFQATLPQAQDALLSPRSHQAKTHHRPKALQPSKLRSLRPKISPPHHAGFIPISTFVPNSRRPKIVALCVSSGFSAGCKAGEEAPESMARPGKKLRALSCFERGMIDREPRSCYEFFPW